MSCALFGLCIYVVLGSAVAHGSPGDGCPRHRGLPEDFPRGNNTYRERALYRIDLRHALKGFEPNGVYKFRVHTNARKVKFNDATIVVEPLDPDCGSGKLLVEDDTLYSPEGCPDVVTTQQKEPMGRAHFRWQAPSCGCVHIRARVHANLLYYIEDEDVHNGALARTVCPKELFNKLLKTAKGDTEKNNSKEEQHESDPRADRLQLLCNASRNTDTEDILKGEEFVGRRHVRIVDEFELDRLHIALAQRKASTRQCCEKGGNERWECFGDVRRRRIDTFCGTGEPEIPFSKSRYDWIKQRKTDCCWQIGEDRYTCFNYTMYRETMPPQDQRADAEGVEGDMVVDLDDFDPANDIEDFPAVRPPVTESPVDKRTRKSKSGSKRKTDIISREKVVTTTESVKNTSVNPNDDANVGNKHINSRHSSIADDVDDTGDIDTDIVENSEESEDVKISREKVVTTTESVKNTSVNPNYDANVGNKHINSRHSSIADDVDDTGDIDTDIVENSEESEDVIETTEVQYNNTDAKDNVNKSSAIEASTVDPSKESLDEDSDDDDPTANDKKDTKSKARKTELDPNRSFSDDECCLNGITTGTLVVAQGFDGCFSVADKFNKMFQHWDRRCDRRFVMCCMRVIDGYSLTDKVAHNLQTRYPVATTSTVVHILVAALCGEFNKITNKHACKRELKKIHLSDKGYKSFQNHKPYIGISMARLTMSQNKVTKLNNNNIYLNMKKEGLSVNSRYNKQRSANLINKIPVGDVMIQQKISSSDYLRNNKDKYRLNEVDHFKATPGDARSESAGTSTSGKI